MSRPYRCQPAKVRLALNHICPNDRIRDEPLIMPLEAILPLSVFGILLILWIVLPARVGEDDLGARIRNLLVGRRRDR